MHQPAMKTGLSAYYGLSYQSVLPWSPQMNTNKTKPWFDILTTLLPAQGLVMKKQHHYDRRLVILSNSY